MASVTTLVRNLQDRLDGMRELLSDTLNGRISTKMAAIKILYKTLETAFQLSEQDDCILTDDLFDSLTTRINDWYAHEWPVPKSSLAMGEPVVFEFCSLLLYQMLLFKKDCGAPNVYWSQI